MEFVDAHSSCGKRICSRRCGVGHTVARKARWMLGEPWDESFVPCHGPAAECCVSPARSCSHFVLWRH